MNLELEQRLREERPPFAGDTVRSAPQVPVPLVRRALGEAVRLLRPATPRDRLFYLEDRPETSVARVTTWDEVQSWLASDQRLFLARSGEPDIPTGIYPESCTFYLRFYVDHEILPPGKPLEGHFDLSCESALARSFEEALVEWDITDTVRSPSRDAFHSR